MYDGSTAHRRGGADGASRHQAPQGGALGRAAPALRRRRRARCRAWPGDDVVALPPTSPRPRTCSRRSTARPPASSCRRPTSSAICAILPPIAETAHAQRRAARRRLHRGVSLGLVTPPGAMGADIVVGEGQSIGNALNFGGPYVGLFATRQKYRPPDARPAVRRDRRRRRPARLRADALDPRAAYPPRQGDLEHLHQFRPLLPRLHDPHDAARRGGPCAASRASTTPMR